MFHQDNAPVQTSTVAMYKINKFKFELLIVRTFFAGFTPFEIFYVSKLEKNGLVVKDLPTMKYSVDGYFKELNSSNYKQGKEAIEFRWEKSFELEEIYFEKPRKF